MENKLVYRILAIISYLSKENGYTVRQLAEKFDTSAKTIYRNIQMLKEAGFQVVTDEQNRYYIKRYNASVFQEKLISFSIDETAMIKDALLAAHSTNPLRNIVLNKLFALSEIDGIVDIFYDQNLGRNIRHLNEAIKKKKQVVLRDYRSSNSNSIQDRLVEPISFHRNMTYFSAYEIKSGKVRQFKPERAASVEILAEPFRFEKFHSLSEPDIFGMNAKPEFIVCLDMNLRAANLLKEEFPSSANRIEPLENSNLFRFQAICKGYEGVGRFVLGLPGDINVVENEGFKKYLRQKIKLFKKSDNIFTMDKI